MRMEPLCKVNRMELHVYEILGIKLFRRIILRFERIRHRKDCNQNENYHPKSISASSFVRFSGYLFYNATLHIVSILLSAVYFAITWSLQFNHLWLDVPMYILVAFNLYCIMLQRYIYLRLKFHVNRAAAKRENRIQVVLNRLSPFLDEKESSEFLEEYHLLQKLSHSIVTGNDCVLGADCTETLNRLATAAEYAEVISPRKETARRKDAPFHQGLSGFTGRTRLIGQTERWVSSLQNILKRPAAGNVLFGYSMITETPECEEAFCRLFPIRTREKVEFTIAALLAAYQQKAR